MPRLLPEGPSSLGASLLSHGVRDCQSTTTGTGRYYWWEQPQVSFLSRQTHVCREKRMLAATKVLSRQNYVCRDKHVFVVTKHVFFRDKSKLVATKVLSR